LQERVFRATNDVLDDHDEIAHGSAKDAQRLILDLRGSMQVETGEEHLVHGVALQPGHEAGKQSIIDANQFGRSEIVQFDGARLERVGY